MRKLIYVSDCKVHDKLKRQYDVFISFVSGENDDVVPDGSYYTLAEFAKYIREVKPYGVGFAFESQDELEYVINLIYDFIWIITRFPTFLLFEEARWSIFPFTAATVALHSYQRCTLQISAFFWICRSSPSYALILSRMNRVNIISAFYRSYKGSRRSILRTAFLHSNSLHG